MHPMLNIAIRATRKAGNFIATSYEKRPFDEKHHQFVTSVQQQAAKRIMETIHQSYPTHTLVYGDVMLKKDPDIKWMVEPLNGVSNFLRRLPHFAISLALRIKERTEMAVVYDPMRNELFTTIRGEGAQLNGYRLRVNKTKDLSGSLLGTFLSAEQKQHASYALNQLILLLVNNKVNFRCSGCAALDFAYVAASRLDGFFAAAIKKPHFVAGEILVREAGGLVTDFSGGHDHEKSESIIAAHPMMLKTMLKTMSEIKTENK